MTRPSNTNNGPVTAGLSPCAEIRLLGPRYGTHAQNGIGGAPVRKHGILCALCLVFLRCLPSKIHPALFQALLHGVESIDDPDWLQCHSSSQSILRGWPVDNSVPIPINDLTRTIAMEMLDMQV